MVRLRSPFPSEAEGKVRSRTFRKLLEAVERANRRHGLLQAGDSLVAGVSGGPDSLAALVLLCALRRKYSLKIAAAHLDHGWSPKENARYLQTSRQVSQALRVPFYFKKVNTRKLARETKKSLEEASRSARYAFFTQVAEKLKAKKIVTAHTLEDQAETVLLRLVRGAGIRGLAAIPFKRPHGKREIIRPFLYTQKKDLVRLLKEKRIPFCVDKSNRDTSFLRNRVRHRLLPILEKHFNPRIRQSLLALQDICGQTQNYLENAARKAFKACLSRKSARGASLKLSGFKRLHPALAREVLFLALQKKGEPYTPLTYEHIESILEIAQKRGDRKLHLPGSLMVRKTGGQLEIDSPSESRYNSPKRSF